MNEQIDHDLAVGKVVWWAIVPLQRNWVDAEWVFGKSFIPTDQSLPCSN